MSDAENGCADCHVRSACLVFRLGLAGVTSGSLRHRLLERTPGELVLEKSDTADIIVVKSGWATKYVMFADGRKQITDIILPGDFIGCVEVAAVGDTLPVQAMSDVQACVFERGSFLSAVTTSPSRMMAVMAECGVQTIRLRNLLAAMGRQAGVARIAAFVSSLNRRLVALGQASRTEMPYYLRQKDLADTLGMTQVHVSRTLRSLYEGGVMTVDEKKINILNPDKLERLARG